MNSLTTCVLCGVESVSPCVRKEPDGKHVSKGEGAITDCSVFAQCAAKPRGPNGGLMIERVGVDIDADMATLRRSEEISLELIRHFVPSFDQQSAAA